MHNKEARQAVRPTSEWELQLQVWPRWLLRETRDRPSLNLLFCSLHTPHCSLPLIVHTPVYCLSVHTPHFSHLFMPLTLHIPHCSHLTIIHGLHCSPPHCLTPHTVHTPHCSRPLLLTPSLFTPDCTWTSLFTLTVHTPQCSQLPLHSRCSDSVSSATTTGENSCTSARTQSCGFPP